MTRSEAWLNHAANLLVGGTGLVYAWMLYLAVPADDFAVVNHPLQPAFHTAHIVAAPLLVFGCGLVFRRHVWARVRSGYPHRRKTGLVLFLLLGPMILSGYLLQVSVEDVWRVTWRWTHVATSLLWVLGYAVHQFSRRPRAEEG